MEQRSPILRSGPVSGRKEPLLGDETAFFRKLIENPRLTGAVAPSGPFLARAMAKAAAPALRDGLVIELGPGTGPVTRALIEQGLPRERLVLVEYDPNFCRLLRQRYAPASVVQGDAYDLRRTLAPFSGRRVSAIVSSLPLLNETPARRFKLIEDAFELMGPQGLFVQFTYGLKSPIPREACVNRFAGRCSAPIWRNLPPARVWSYRADPNGMVANPMINKLRDHADELRCTFNEKKREAERLLRRQRARVRVLLDRDARTRFSAIRRRETETRP